MSVTGAPTMGKRGRVLWRRTAHIDFRAYLSDDCAVREGEQLAVLHLAQRVTADEVSGAGGVSIAATADAELEHVDDAGSPPFRILLESPSFACRQLAVGDADVKVGLKPSRQATTCIHASVQCMINAVEAHDFVVCLPIASCVSNL